jgi:hypothetical protein
MRYDNNHTTTTQQFHVFYIFMYGWCVCVCVVCVYNDDDVTESIFKMKIYNFLQYAER